VAVTQIDIDQDALDRVMALSGARTNKDAVNLALRYYAERQERAARIARASTAPGTGEPSRTSKG
jgi:Arc/MetJ family transcription regulator